jgi:ribonuclease BN (tRNA processing enzyme)
VKLTVVGCSPAWPNPGGAQSGYLVEDDGRRLLLDCGPGVLARLREGDDWPEVDAIVITHFHLDHWGDVVPWVWGALYLGLQDEQPELWVPPDGRRELDAFSARFGIPDMFDRAFVVAEYRDGEPFRAAGFDLLPLLLPHYTLRTYGLRVSNSHRTLAYSGDSAPSDRLADLARGVDLFVCEATLASGAVDGEPRGHLSADEAVAAFEASGARRLLLTHRPHELPLADGLEQAFDGMQLDV